MTPSLQLLLILNIYSATANIFVYDDACEPGLDTIVVDPSIDCVCLSHGEYLFHKRCSKTTSNYFTNTFHCAALPIGTTAITKLENNTSTAQLFGSLPQCVAEYHTRVKREDTNTPLNLTEIDEDFTSAGKEVGQEIMLNQMNSYIEDVIAKLTGLQGEGKTTKAVKYPVIRLLEYTKQIMQKTCSIVNGDYFDLALNSFINLQMETYHVKEPYISYSSFKRIEYAMTRCLQRANPHVFVLPNITADGSNPSPDILCNNHMPSKSSNTTILNAGTENEVTQEIVVPNYAKSELEPGKVAEPLIESVWKMLVSAHSYCYKYFSEYYNDHHTYTVALLPLFTNEIQDVWLNTDGKGYDLTDKSNKLYGGMLGDVVSILRDVDLCTGASKVMSSYPWFMNRPMRDNANGWNDRRKRSVEENGDSPRCTTIEEVNKGCS